MGQEIARSYFGPEDFSRFSAELETETALLRRLFEEQTLSNLHGTAGFELEAWLVRNDGMPAPINQEYLPLLGDESLYSPELSRFNVELNSTPRQLGGHTLSAMQNELQSNWDYCRATAQRLNADLVMTGILPTLRDEQLTLAQMSQMARYRALNDQVMRLREGRPLQLDILGEEHLRSVHHDVMLEAATTSFQIHLQVSQRHALRFYNAMVIASAPMVALGANSPLLFGRRLWHETRIPLFEQAVEVGGIAGAAKGPLHRVSFGSGYARHSLLELFVENQQHFPVLLPMRQQEAMDRLPHLRLHNGTIWRWNRPLIGFDADGTPHLRIEHRVLPAGPSVIDTMANMAFFFGLVHSLATADEAPEQQLSFAVARDNFYRAARLGLHAPLNWMEARRGRARELLRELLPQAASGLRQMGCDSSEITDYMAVIDERLERGQNGAQWQLNWLQQHGNDMAGLLASYREWQQGGEPVHRWTV